MEPLQHVILLFTAMALCQFLPRRQSVHVLGFAGLGALAIFAPAAAVFLFFTVIEAIIMVTMFGKLDRGSTWRQYGPYLLLFNLFFVDLHIWLLNMPVATLAISFSTIRIFMTIKQLLSSRKKLPFSDCYWIFAAAFFLPAIVIGPVFSGTSLRDQYRDGALENVALRDYRMVLQGLILVILVSPFFGKIAEYVSRLGPDFLPTDWPLLFLQLFAAFWGQSLIAEHMSRFFGYRLPINFDHPWKADTIKDFWARWHRSMANFVLQYIFLPLNVKGVSPKLATIAAFTFMGLWHNLSLGYFVWGLCHGLLLAYGRPTFGLTHLRHTQRVLLWIIIISLSWFANYGPVS